LGDPKTETLVDVERVSSNSIKADYPGKNDDGDDNAQFKNGDPAPEM